MVALMLLAALLGSQEPRLRPSGSGEARRSEAEAARRVTVIYDAFGTPSSLERDWGFAALVEYGGKRVLFDTGNDAGIFERNARTLQVDLTKLDAVFLSHRHGDHTSGLSYLLKMNPEVRVLVPPEGAYFKGAIPRGFLERYPELPENLRYYGGQEPERWVSGTPWPEARFEIVTETTEILPGFFALVTKSQKPGTIEMNEVSLAIRTPEGLAVIVGCSHPGVEKILEGAATIDPNLYTVTGGFHLVMTAEPEVRRVAELLRDQFRIERVAPGHCTSELGFAVFQKSFGERFDAAGVGAVIPLP